MNMTTLDDVLMLARQLTPADQAQLGAHLAPGIASALAAQNRTTTSYGPKLGPRAAQLAANPDSALARVLGIAGDGSKSLTDADIERLRDERLSERYGV